MVVFSRLMAAVIISSFSATGATAQQLPSEHVADTDEASLPELESPWILTPTASSNPKLGTTLGAMGAYIHKFDADSPASSFGLTGSYSTTDSFFIVGFGKAFFSHDTRRLSVAAITGQINNDYSDFAGSGLPLSTTDDLTAFALRFSARVQGDWFVGAQGLSTNYVIAGDDFLSGEIIEQVGLTGFDSNGLGLLVEYDTLDNQNSPSTGSFFNLNNIAYRKSLGGDESFDVYSAQYRTYFAHGGGNVLALKASTKVTDGAPAGGQATVRLPGYVSGQYLGEKMASFQFDERYYLREKWAASVSGGLACLYDALSECGGRDHWYPSLGVGVIYTIKPSEGMVIRADYAQGEQGNSGFYLQFGQLF